MRALKTELGTVAPPPGSPEATAAAPQAASLAAAPLPIARALENSIASVIAGAPSRLVLALSEEGSDLAASFAAACETTRRRALHVALGAGPSLGARAHQGLVPALRARTNGRPGVAVLLDPLIKTAASFVLGDDLWSLASFLTPEALDEVPAVASRVLLTRFVPALAAQLPEVPRELIAALFAERTGSDEHALEPIASAIPGPVLLAALAKIATRAGSVLVVSCAEATDAAAASALEAAQSLEGATTGLVWALGSRRDAWEVQRALLDDSERARIERAVAPPAAAPASEPAAPTPSAPAGAPATPVVSAPSLPESAHPALGANLSPRARAAARRAGPSSSPSPVASGPGAPPRLEGSDETPPLAIPRPLGVKRALAERLKTSVAARLARKKATPAAATTAPATASATEAPKKKGRRETVSGTFRSAWSPRPFGDAQPTGLKRALIVLLPFIFLSSLGIFARREADFRATPHQTEDWVIKLAANHGRVPGSAVPASNGTKPTAKPAAPAPTPAPPPQAQSAVARQPAPATPPPAQPQQPASQMPAHRESGIHSPNTAVAEKKDDPRPANQGTTVQDRLLAAERMPQGNDQLAALVQLYDTKFDSEADASLTKRGVLLRLAPYRNEPEALDRILKALDSTSSRDLRLTAVQSLSIGNTALPPAARSKLQTIVSEDTDEAVKSAAQIALAAQPR